MKEHIDNNKNSSAQAKAKQIALRLPWNRLALAAIMLLSLSAQELAAQQLPKAREDRQLQQLFQHIKNAEGYSYHINLASAIATDTQKVVAQDKINYSSKEALVMYSKSETELYFLCKKGQFSIDQTHKKVQYRIFEDDSVSSQLKAFFQNQVASMMDSIFLNDALVLEQKKTSKKIYYRLAYPQNAAMKSFEIRASLADGIPEYVKYSIEQAPQEQAILIRQTFTMDQYQHSMPEELKNILAHADNLYHFLQEKYVGYTFQTL